MVGLPKPLDKNNILIDFLADLDDFGIEISTLGSQAPQSAFEAPDLVDPLTVFRHTSDCSHESLSPCSNVSSLYRGSTEKHNIWNKREFRLVSR